MGFNGLRGSIDDLLDSATRLADGNAEDRRAEGSNHAPAVARHAGQFHDEGRKSLTKAGAEYKRLYKGVFKWAIIFVQ